MEEIKNKLLKIEEIKNLVKSDDQQVMISINGVDFDYCGYDSRDDTAFLFSYDHDIEVALDRGTKDYILDQLLDQLR
jgi:hypothetical protein